MKSTRPCGALEEMMRRSILLLMIMACSTKETTTAAVTHSSSATSAVAAPSLAIWKTLQLGTDQPTDPAAELEKHGFKVSDWAKELIAKTSFATEPTTVDLVKVSVADLGFPNGASTKKIFDRAISLGLNRLPAEAGYRLRFVLTDQPMHEWIRIGMDPIAVSDGDPRVWDVDHDGGARWLSTHCVSPALEWDPEDVWVFGRSKPR